LNRREFVTRASRLAFGAAAFQSNRLPRISFGGERSAASAQEGAEALPRKVAGVPIVDSTIARDATLLCRTESPRYLFNHAVRTYLFGSLIGRSLALKFDAEVLYLACILHDLGLTARFDGDLPFEIQGAEAAKRFLEERGYPRTRIDTVWDGIAMHASFIGHFKRPEIRLVGEGAGADVIGSDPSQISKDNVDAIITAVPRLHFKSSFVAICADVVRRHPGGAGRSFMRDIGERRVEGFHPRNFCDLIDKAPYPE
jgi:hypothetical protein